MIGPLRLMGVLLLLVLAAPTAAEMVEPTDRVTSGVLIRERATTDSPVVGTLRPGEQLEHAGSVPSWRRVRHADGRIGYVSKSWTRIVALVSFTLHAVDVGTGLAIVVEGSDFLLLYDGGSNDDLARGDDNRLLAYLRAALPDRTQIDHVILSHPHRDHVELLPDVLAAFKVRNVWDSGALHDTCSYRAFITAVRDEAGVVYRAAARDAGANALSFPAKTCRGQALPAEEIQLPHGPRLDNERVALGQAAAMVFLHVDGSDHGREFNRNSLVVRLDLGDKKVLLMGDAEAGGRADPSAAPRPDSVEGALLACCRDELRADVLVVGHHGSKSSSRRAFLDAVEAAVFIVSIGPVKYGPVTLPDSEVIEELERRGSVFRTDLDDAGCRSHAAKIGPDADGRPGGCDNVHVRLTPGDPPAATYWRAAD